MGSFTTAVRTPVCQGEVVGNLQLVNDTAASGAGNVTLALLCVQFPISTTSSVLRAAGPPETVARSLQKLTEWPSLVYPCFVDWDRDGEMEAIGVDLTGGSRLQYYSAGHCVSAPRCHGGTCNPNGQCTCPKLGLIREALYCGGGRVGLSQFVGSRLSIGAVIVPASPQPTAGLKCWLQLKLFPQAQSLNDPRTGAWNLLKSILAAGDNDCSKLKKPFGIFASLFWL